MSKTKYEKAKKHSSLARNGCMTTYRALWNLLPADIIANLTSRQIGTMIDLLYRQKTYGENEIFYELYHLAPIGESK